METAFKFRKVANLYIEKLIREASDNFCYNRDYETALKQVEEVLSVEPYNTRALILKGDILFCMDLDEQALNCFDKAIKSNTNSAEAYGSKAGILDVLGRYDEAIKFCEKAFELIKPKDKFLLPSLFDQKITLLLRMRRYEEAKAILNKAIKILPEDDASYLRSCYFSMIDSSCKLRRRKLAQAEKLSLKVI